MLSHHRCCRIEEEAAFVSTRPAEVLSRLLPNAATLRFETCHVDETAAQLTVWVHSTATMSPCPLCATPAIRLHSHYERTLVDLPWAGYRVRLQLRVHKWFCDQEACQRRIFTERLPHIAQPWARRTLRLAQSLLAVGVVLGGRAGSRLTQRLQRPTPWSSLLRLVQHAPLPQAIAFTAVGVDEWAWRRGSQYGTIFVDLETHRVIDLLPDRSADSVAQWLRDHPSITVVSRDRSGLYAHGITQGAPRAIQVVDRFPLVSNLREALETFFLAHPTVLKTAAVKTAQGIGEQAGALPVVERYRGRRHSPQNWKKRQDKKRQQLHKPRVAIYHKIRQLYESDVTITQIARQLKSSRPTVDRHLHRGRPPEQKTRTASPSRHVLTPYIPYLIQGWRESGADSMQLWREIQSQGYQHSARTVARFITELRRASEAGRPPEIVPSAYTRAEGPSARSVSFLLVRRHEKRSHVAQLYLEQLCEVEAKVARLDELAQSFLTMVRERRGEVLASWRTQAAESGIGPLARFAEGLQEDLAAIQAGLTLPWSNEHIAYCTSSPASWCLKRRDTPPATAGRDGVQWHK